MKNVSLLSKIMLSGMFALSIVGYSSGMKKAIQGFSKLKLGRRLISKHNFSITELKNNLYRRVDLSVPEDQTMKMIGGSYKVVSAAFHVNNESPLQNMVAARFSNGSSDHIGLWGIRSKEFLGWIPYQMNPNKSHGSSAMTFVYGGKVLAFSDNNKVVLHNLETQNTDTELLHYQCKTISTLTVSPDGKFLVYGTIDGLIYLWELSDSGVYFSDIFHVNSFPEKVLTLSIIEETLYASTSNGTIKAWSIKDGRSATLRIGNQTKENVVIAAAFRQQGEYYAEIDTQANFSILKITKNKKLVALKSLPGTGGNFLNKQGNIVFSPDGKSVRFNFSAFDGFDKYTKTHIEDLPQLEITYKQLYENGYKNGYDDGEDDGEWTGGIIGGCIGYVLGSSR